MTVIEGTSEPIVKDPSKNMAVDKSKTQADSNHSPVRLLRSNALVSVLLSGVLTE